MHCLAIRILVKTSEMSEKPQTFLITIAIIEGRHYAWPNMNSVVFVKIDNQKKYSAVKLNSDCPYYNEYFVFEFLSTLDQFLDKSIIITVLKPGGCLKKRKTLGFVSLDVATVWYQEDHQFYHKWAILSAPSKDLMGGTRGYLKLNISVLSRGEVPKIPLVTNTEEIEGNLLLPEGTITERQRANFIFDIYRGEDLVKKLPTNENTKKSNDSLPSPSIEIVFAGLRIKTSIKRNTSTPEWNERLILPELFPPLCQRIRVELHLGEGKKYVFRYLNLRSISNDKEEGFLPMFGPTFLYFYSKNNLEGYMGKILMGLHTELISNALETEIKPVPVLAVPTKQEKVVKYDEFGLFASIIGVSSISHKYHDKPISFRIACGRCLSSIDDSRDTLTACVTNEVKPKVTNRNLCYLPLDSQKPCLSLFLVLPDFRKRMYIYNHLIKIVRDLKFKINDIEGVFSRYDHNTTGSQDLIMETLDMVVFAIDKYLDIVSSYDSHDSTILEQERTKMIIKEMKDIKQKALTIYLVKSKRKCFRKIEKLYNRLKTLVDNEEDWPAIYLWMIHGNKRVAYSIIQPKTVIHSLVEEERGVNCGNLQTIYFQPQSDKSLNAIEYISMVAKMDVVLWMGLVRHKDNYLKNLPEGFRPDPEEIPKNLIPLEAYEFQCRVHIFQGRFTPGSDKSGLCDPFIHVVIEKQYRETQILRKTLNPIWDQTLVFTNITIQGSRNFIKNHPPTIFIEVYDRDECCRNEFVGRAAAKPVVKMAEDPYSAPDFPPKLSWCQIYSKFDVSAEILAAFELLESSAGLEEMKDEGAVMAIPSNIKPILVNYKVEVVFWGVRNLKKVQMMYVSRPKIVIECVNSSVTSDTLVNAKKNLNFSNSVKSFEVVFPEQEEYAPPVWLKIYDCRNFGINVFAGTHIVPINAFLYTPMTVDERKQKFLELEKQSFDDTVNPSVDSIIAMVETQDHEENLGKAPSFASSIYDHQSCNLKKFCSRFMCCKKTLKSPSSIIYEDNAHVDEDFDWWTKFYASMEETESADGKLLPAHKYKLKIYQNELELQPEFAGFTDLLTSFQMYKGKRTGDEAVDEENTTAVFKGSIKIYRWPPVGEGKYVTGGGLALENGIFQDFPSNSPLRYILRVYCVRAIGLRPKDLNGKSDPYLLITLNEKIVNDKENCVMRQINPVFGRCFEFNAMFPQDHTLTVAVYDWDLTTKDDLIGETKIDLENRFYTQHRANCGLAADYQETGYCQWRDQQKPTTILENLCKKFNLAHPEYGASSVKVAHNEFQADNFPAGESKEFNRQVLALAALRRWQEIPVVGRPLVPEHVETRSLYNPNKPGIEQGKLQLWVDIFPFTDFPTPKQVNIAPRKPVSYELRVIVWNAEDIKMDEDDFFTGEKKSDIFIKGWLGEPHNVQYTDIHYRSISGEGNFNWRFIFPFDYLSTENKLVVRQKETIFAIDESEFKLPCRLTLQVWDNDSFSSDEFLGTLCIELSRLPRGARAAKKCTLALLRPDAPVLNLFKVRRTKGWWPFRNFDNDNVEIFAGSIEIEMELLTVEDAEKVPAGLGRDEPQGLPRPKRPDTSFSWFRNPFKAIKYVVKLHKWKILVGFAVVAAVLMLAVACYAFPGYTVKKILGA